MSPAIESKHQILSAEDELHWLALRLIPGLGTRRSVQLIERLKTPVAAFRASRSELEGLGLAGSVAQSIASGCTFDEAVLQQEQLRDAGATLIPYTSPLYPENLRTIYDPPLTLFAMGRVELLATAMLAVVGTRRPTAYGKAVAERLSADLAQAGLTIISGMARGIDTAAHSATLKAGGNTVAVFGCGVDLVYPAENRKLAGEIAEKGLVLSEFPMRTPAYPQNFPVRNRVVSGLSVGVLVVEGAQYSGSSITARLALEQGREVFAVPGNVTSKMSWGPNLLIKQGAKLVQEWNDVVGELDAGVRRRLASEGMDVLDLTDDDSVPAEPELPTGPMGQVCRAALALLKTDEPTQLDTLLESSDIYSSSEMIAALFELEMLGLVRQLPGKNFVKVWSGA